MCGRLVQAAPQPDFRRAHSKPEESQCPKRPKCRPSQSTPRKPRPTRSARLQSLQWRAPESQRPGTAATSPPRRWLKARADQSSLQRHGAEELSRIEEGSSPSLRPGRYGRTGSDTTDTPPWAGHLPPPPAGPPKGALRPAERTHCISPPARVRRAANPFFADHPARSGRYANIRSCDGLPSWRDAENSARYRGTAPAWRFSALRLPGRRWICGFMRSWTLGAHPCPRPLTNAVPLHDEPAAGDVATRVLLLRTTHAHVSRLRRWLRLRARDRGQGQRPGGSPRGARPCLLETRARGARDQHRPLSVGGGTLPGRCGESGRPFATPPTPARSSRSLRYCCATCR